jgi:hypothetical protein
MNKEYNLVRGIALSIPLLPIGLFSGFMAVVSITQIIITGWGLGNLINIPELEILNFTDSISILDWAFGGAGANPESFEMWFQFMMFAIPSSICFALVAWAFERKSNEQK